MVRLNGAVTAWRLSKMCSGHGKQNAKIFRVILNEDVKLAKGVIELRMHPDNVEERGKEVGPKQEKKWGPGAVLLCVAPAQVPLLSLFLQPVIQGLIQSQRLECLPQSRKSQKDVEELCKHGELAHGVENAHLGFLQKIYLGEFRDIIRMHAEFDNPLGQLDILLQNHSKNLGIVLPMSRAHLGQPPRGHCAVQTKHDDFV
ncbi:hypothetical protein C1H46_039904 [Malus baccata]|uniref:Uncharacterized protein n=1 Tax=Malus baccata TaxID=106549 RepID=A0A540KK43_MALBA|nr:hypothetical protein C1H46_039904 [Malus baccata]